MHMEPGKTQQNTKTARVALKPGVLGLNLWLSWSLRVVLKFFTTTSHLKTVADQDLQTREKGLELARLLD